MTLPRSRPIENHPTQKCLSIFPALPQKVPNLIERPSPRTSQEAQHFQVLGCQTELQKRKKKSKNDELTPRSKKNNIDEMTLKLERAARNMSAALKRRSSVNELILPPIVQLPNRGVEAKFARAGNRPLQSESSGKGYKAFILPVISREDCSCPKSKTKPRKVRLDDMMVNRSAKKFRPEDAPPLLSVYVRWKNRRDGSPEYNYQSLLEVFGNFGVIEKVIFRGPNSAAIIFTTMEAALSSARVMQKVGREMNLHTKWMNDMNVKAGKKKSKKKILDR